MNSACSSFVLAVGAHVFEAHGEEDARGLRAAHHADLGVGPHPEEAGLVGASAHGVVAGAERPAEYHRELGNLGGGDGGHHLRAVLGDAFVLVLLADHEAGYVLQEDERHLPLCAQLDEVSALQCAL
jgi:hypothetical protein